MTSKSLLMSGLRASISSAPRAARADFWVFAPFGLSLCVVAGVIASALEFTFMGIALTVLFAGTPLIALWWRRLQDVGIAGIHALLPWVSLLVFFLAATAAYTLHNRTEFALAGARAHLWSWLLVPEVLFRFVGGKWVAMLVALGGLVVFLFRFSFALSHAMLQSDPKTNRYGPNPHEVPQ